MSETWNILIACGPNNGETKIYNLIFSQIVYKVLEKGKDVILQFWQLSFWLLGYNYEIAHIPKESENELPLNKQKHGIKFSFRLSLHHLLSLWNNIRVKKENNERCEDCQESCRGFESSCSQQRQKKLNRGATLRGLKNGQ